MRVKFEKYRYEFYYNFKVNVKATGNGMALFQLITNYHIPKMPDTLNFNLTQKTLNVNFTDLNVKTCVIYDTESSPNKSNSTGMALIEATLLSGYTVNEQELENLVKNKSIEYLKLVEIIDDNRVVFYLDKLDDNKEVCIEWTMVKQIQVDNLKPTLVKVYDYYQSNLEYTILFNPFSGN